MAVSLSEAQKRHGLAHKWIILTVLQIMKLFCMAFLGVLSAANTISVSTFVKLQKPFIESLSLSEEAHRPLT